MILFSACGVSQATIQQEISKDSVYLEKVVVDSITYYRQFRYIEYDGGGFSHNCSPELIDSTTLAQRVFRDAHQTMRPVAQAYKVTTSIGQFKSAFNNYAAIIDTITGGTYFDLSQTRYGAPYDKKVFRLRRLQEDTILLDLYVFKNGVNNLVTRESDIVFNNQDKTFTRTFVGGGFSSRVLLYETDYMKINSLDGNLFLEFVRFPIVDDNGLESGRYVWRDTTLSYVMIEMEHTEE